MGNRTIQQKVNKMKRMRRAHLKKFSTKNTGPIKYPGFFNEKGDFIDMSLRSRSEAAKGCFDEYLIKKFRFNVNSNEAIYARHNGLHTDMTPDKEIVLARMVQSREGAATLQGEQKLVNQLLVDRETCIRRLFMGGDVNFIIERRVTKEGVIWLKSYNYSTRQRAFQAHLSEDINWDEITPASELTKSSG